ncbi:hypothetical protein [Nostoc sp. NMS4]|uniref:hypothetical protein n=1 Tax=Nostoc sp. NMS4 TaxID=2815390 RepID=UPI0025F9A835|nr:hypothetical protein [Nostoc sp. NMS4]
MGYSILTIAFVMWATSNKMGAISTSRLAASLVRLTRAIASSRRWRKFGKRVSNSEAATGKLIFQNSELQA